MRFPVLEGTARAHRPLHELCSFQGKGLKKYPAPHSPHIPLALLNPFLCSCAVTPLPQNLEQVLQQLSLLPQGKGLEEYPALEKEYRILWADHGDAIATQYAGEVVIGGVGKPEPWLAPSGTSSSSSSIV